MSRQKKFFYFLTVLYLSLTVFMLGLEISAFTYLAEAQGGLSESKYRLTKVSEKIENLNSLKTKYSEVEGDLTRINTALPDKKESSKLLADLDSLARSSGLKLTLLQTASYGKKPKGTGDPSLLQTVKGKYGQEIPLDIKAEGPFQKVVSFVRTLENYQRVVTVSAIEITKAEEVGAPADNVELKLKLTAYLKK